MGKRGRRRGDAEKLEALQAPTSEYTGPEGAVLVLRGVMSPRTRTQYARVADPSHARAAATAEDVWARAIEFLFERLVVCWVVHDVPTEGPRELLARYRVATAAERAWVRDVLREHCAERFPDVQVP
jgi:hypothetical protein